MSLRLIFLPLIFVSVLTFAQGKVQLLGFSASDCDDGVKNANMLRTRIIEKKISGDVLHVKIGTKETCCLGFKGVVKYYSNSNGGADTLYLGLKSFGEPCECDCYYELVYKIKVVRSPNLEIKFKGNPIETTHEKYKTYPVRYKLLGNDTINLVDKYGLRQGIWIFDSTKITRYFSFLNDIWIRQVYLFDSGKIRKEQRKEFGNWNYQVEYFESGEKKFECYNDRPGESFRQGSCKGWDVDGKLIYDGPFRADMEEQPGPP